MSRNNASIIAVPVIIMIMAVWARADEPKPQDQGSPDQKSCPGKNGTNYDMVSDTAAAALRKANAALSWNLDFKMTPKVEKKSDYTTNAMGLRVPKSTAVRTGGALHNDEPL